jgi:uncharacterized OsmC-like protein
MADTLRTVDIDRTGAGRYRARNPRGAEILIGPDDETFTPVELLLAAIASCTATDADVATSRHAEPDHFTVTATGDKIRDEHGNHLVNLTVTFDVTFPEGATGDAARAILPRAVKLSHDKLCTVSRTVELGTPVTSVIS